MTGHHCNCGHYMRTIGGMRAHAKKCGYADAKLRAAEDRVRVDSIQRAKKINDEARADSERL